MAGPDWSVLSERLAAGLGRVGLAAPPGEPVEPLARVMRPALPADGWLVGGPMTADSLAGRISVLVVFSSVHPTTPAALPIAQAWHDAYARYGVRVIGVHAPEYAFATDPAVPERLWRSLGLTFPLVHDPSLGVLAALGSHTNDVQVFVADTSGALQKPRTIRDAVADGAIAEHAIRVLLRRTQPAVPFPDDDLHALARLEMPRAPVRSVRLGVPAQTRGPLGGLAPGPARPFTAQFRHQIEGEAFVPYPVGWWAPRADGLEAARGGATNFVAIRYDAARVGVVVSPPAARTAKLWLLGDEHWLGRDELGADAKQDASGASYVAVGAPGLYLIARGQGERVLKISPDEPGTTIHAFTFEGKLPRP